MSEVAQIRRWQAPEVSAAVSAPDASGPAGSGPAVFAPDGSGPVSARVGPPRTASPSPGTPNEQSMLTAERLAEIEEQARQSGYRAGFDEGKQDAEKLKRAYGEQFSDLLASIAPQAVLLDDAYVEQTSHLVVAIARQLIRRELKRDPGEVVQAVREALGVLPVSDAAVRIFLHPDDVALVREMLKPEVLERPIKLTEDVAMTRGGARVETDVSVVDASVEARIAAVAAGVFGDERTEPQPAADAG